MKKTLFVFLSALALPLVAAAQQFNPTYVDRVVGVGQRWLGTAVTILMILMTIWFLWSVFKFIGEKDATKMKDRKKQMINGLIGLFVAVAVWGIIRIATNIFGINPDAQNFGITCPPGYESAGSGCVPRP